MRLSAFILSIIILALSLVPCSDDDNCNEPNIALSSDHSGHEHDEDSCTPFCTCSCCGCAGFVLAAPILNVEFPEVKTQIQPATTYNSDFTSSYFYFFWQPPKI